MSRLMTFLFLFLSVTIHAETHVLAFAGSTRSDSVNKKLIHEAAEIARQQGATVKVIDLKDYPMPFYDADSEAKEGMPFHAKQFRDLLLQNQVIIIASPEYNGSLSGVLKNAIDWASRSESSKPSTDAFKGKKFVIMSASPGGGGGFNGLVHLRAILGNIGGVVVAQQLTIPYAYAAFDQLGHLKNAQEKEELRQLITQALKPQTIDTTPSITPTIKKHR